jgi:hypothetical protein
MIRNRLSAFVIAASLAVAGLTGYHVLPALAQSIGQIFVAQDGLPGAPSVYGASDSSSGIYFASGKTGFTRHMNAGSTATNNLPVLSSCGTTPALTTGSTDTAGTVTMGTTATGCVITFGTAHAAAPACIVTWRATPLASQSYTTSTAALTLTQTSTSNNLIDYVCIGRGG